MNFIRAETEGDAELRLDFVGVVKDSSGDGIPDVVTELDLKIDEGYGGVRGTSLEIDPTTKYTTKDGLADADQVEIEWGYEEHWRDGWSFEAEIAEIHADPAKTDTTGDGLSDKEQIEGWYVPVVNKSGYEDPYRWDGSRGGLFGECEHMAPDETCGIDRFHAEPLEYDSSDNGIDDVTEKEVLRTDPEAEQTYAITAKQEARLDDLFAGVTEATEGDTFTPIDSLEPVGLDEQYWEARDAGETNLTDANADFGFVADPTDCGFSTEDTHWLTYRTPDGECRSDVWLSNEEVLDFNENNDGELDPWDPDTDGDGLTDGQELGGITYVTLSDGGVAEDDDRTYEDLDPTDPDTDGDAVLDGGGHQIVNDIYEIGGRHTEDDIYLEEGEVWHLDTDPTGEPNVATVLVVTDENFREQHGDYKEKARGMIEFSNEKFEENFGEDEVTPQLVIREWDEWDGQREDLEGDSAPDHRDELVADIDWADDQRGNDILIGFSGNQMGAPEGGIPYISRFSDGAARSWNSRHDAESVAMLGTHDLTARAPVLDWEYDLLLHEIGHIYTASHPGARDDIPNGTSGVMCKETCVEVLPGVGGTPIIIYDGMYATTEFSEPNRERVLNNVENVAQKGDPYE